MIRVHKILCSAESFAAAESYVRGFFEKSMLIRYDTIIIEPNCSLAATDPKFWTEMEMAVGHNRTTLRKHFDELQESGCRSLADCEKLEPGYQSKLLHIIAHFLDGFIGIDSLFYCLPDDSHWLSGNMKKRILKDSTKFWLIHVEGHFLSESKASLIHT